MLYLDDIKVELESQGFQGTHIGISHNKDKSVLFLESVRSTQTVRCPYCGGSVYIYENGQVKLKDIPIQRGTTHIWNFFIHRYQCNCCHETFTEEIPFKYPGTRIAYRAANWIKGFLQQKMSIKAIQELTGIHWDTIRKVQREIMDEAIWEREKMLREEGYKPRILAADEFKGNTNSEKYQCILTDPVNKVVLDILPKRYAHFLTEYFNHFDKSQRDKVQFFVSDMWKPYSNISSVWFKNASQIVDKYHWIRQVIWAFEAVRKQEQKKFSKSHRRYFKQSRQLLLKRFDLLSDEQKQQVNVMLYTSPTLSTAHFYKEDFLKILDCKDRQSAKTAFSDWINSALDCGIPQFKKCANTMINWLPGILNSFSSAITNGFTEGCNNKIKGLKRNAYGYRNFKRFRNRILHMFSHQMQKQAIA